MITLAEKQLTNALLIDELDLWFELDNKSIDDEDAKKYYDLIDNLIDTQLNESINWLESDTAKEYFFNDIELQKEIFDALEDAWDEILSNHYDSVDELLDTIYDHGKKRGYENIQETLRYTDADRQAIRLCKDYNFHLIRKLSNDLRSNVKDKILQGIISGENPYNLRKTLVDVGVKPLKDSTLTARQRATMIAKTETSRMQNTGMLQSYIIEGYTEVKILTSEDDNVCTTCLDYAYKFNKDEKRVFSSDLLKREKVHNIIDLIKGGLFPPFHPLCRCTYLTVWETKVDALENPPIINLTPMLRSDNVKTYFKSDNTPIDELNTIKFNEELNIFREFTNGSPIEKAEFWDINGNPLSSVLYGTENEIIIPPDVALAAMRNGAKILIHNHPNRYNNVHSISDLKFQLAYNIKYCIVESFSQRFIVKYDEKTAKFSREHVFSELDDFEMEYRKKISDLTDEELKNYDVESMSDDEYYDLRDKIWKEKNKDNHYEYQQRLSSFFNEDTGLTLYVYDVERRM